MLYAELAIATWYELAKGLNQAATPPFTVEPCLARCGETFHNFPIHLRGKVPEPGAPFPGDFCTSGILV